MRDSNLKSNFQNYLQPNRSIHPACDGYKDALTVEQTEVLIRSMDDLVFVLDTERNFIKCFQPESSNLLMPPGLFLGKNLSTIPFSAEVMKLMQEAFDLAEESGVTQTLDYSLLIDEKLKWFSSKISKIAIVDKLDGFIVVARDITEWKENIQQLEANEKKYHLLADNTTDLVALYSPEGIIEYISPSVHRLLGYDPDSLIGIDPSASVHPDDLAYIKEHFHTELYTGDSFFSAEYRLLHADGYWVHFSSNRKPIRNEQGKITHILACCRDITEKIESNAALKKSEAHYRLLADNILDLVGLHNPDGVFEYVSPSSLTVLGYTPEELVGQNAFALIHPEESANLLEKNRNKTSEGRDTFMDEFRILHKQGHYIYFETTTKIIRDNENRPVKFLSTSRDISDWKKSQCALKESEEKYRGLVESSDNMIALIDYDCRYLFVNSVVASFIGAKPEEIVGKTLGELSRSEQTTLYIEKVKKVIAEERIISSEDRLEIGGREYWLRTAMHPIRNSEGKIYAALANAIDITNLKKTEALMAEQNKGLKEIAFLQSHVLRAPLSNIKYLISLLDKDSLSDENKMLFNLLQISANNLDDAVKQIIDKTYLSEI